MPEIQSRRFCPSHRVSERFWMLWHAGGAQFRRDSRQQFQFNRRIRVKIVNGVKKFLKFFSGPNSKGLLFRNKRPFLTRWLIEMGHTDHPEQSARHFPCGPGRDQKTDASMMESTSSSTSRGACSMSFMPRDRKSSDFICSHITKPVSDVRPAMET